MYSFMQFIFFFFLIKDLANTLLQKYLSTCQSTTPKTLTSTKFTAGVQNHTLKCHLTDIAVNGNQGYRSMKA